MSLHCRSCLLTSRQQSFVLALRRHTHNLSHEKNLYRVLGVKADATQAAIKDAFYIKSKEVHPDLNPEVNNSEQFILLHKAYKTLGDESSRRSYDFSIKVTKNYQDNMRKAFEKSPLNHSIFRDADQSGRIFHDETIWSMRDHSKDKNMVDDEYYGVKGVKKKSNAYVITWLIMFTVVGTFLYALTGVYVSGNHATWLDERDRRNLAFLNNVRHRAVTTNTDEKISQLRTRLEGVSARRKGIAAENDP